ncbi:MAG: aminotransferase class I/II-fold pyridoxal phosphate-dependent enzyme [bacterium]
MEKHGKTGMCGIPYALVSPAIESARGRTRQLIEELRAQWRNGSNEGAGEICAVVNALTDEANLWLAFKQTAGSPIINLLQDFLKLLKSCDCYRNKTFQRILRERGEQSVDIHLAGLASATGALHSSLQALGVAGGEVITTSLNYVGVINSIILAGARPRFVEIDRRTWCMDPSAARSAVNENTRAILLTHLNHFVELEPFHEICEAEGRHLPLVQDASLAIGSTCDGLRPGLLNIGRPGVTVFSLTVSKIISGLGGAIAVSDSVDLIRQIQTIANQGLNPLNECEVEDCGANYKLSALNAAIACEMLKRFEQIVARRRELRLLFDEALAPLVSEGLIELQALRSDDTVTHYGILLPQGGNWRELARVLFDRHGITSGRWHCLHMETFYRNILGLANLSLPVTEDIEPRLFFLPFHTALSDDDARFICEKTTEEIRAASK